MSAIPDRALAAHKSSLDTLLAFQSAAFSGVEKLIDLNLKVTRAALDEAAARTQEVLSLKDPQQAVAYSASVAQPGTDKLVSYGKDVYQIVASVQSDFTRLTEARIAEHQQQVADALEQFAKNAPVGSESAVAMLRGAVANASSAYDTVNKAARQASQIAEQNIAAAATASFDAAKAAGDTARAATDRVRKATASAVSDVNNAQNG